MNHVYSYTNRQNKEFIFGLNDSSSRVKTEAIEYQQLSHYHIKLASIMHSHNQFQACLILCDWALASLIKALYIQKYRAVHPPKELTMNEILPLVHTDTVPGLDIALFIGTIQHMSCMGEFKQDQTLKANNIKKLLQRTEEILKELEKRLKHELPELK